MGFEYVLIDRLSVRTSAYLTLHPCSRKPAGSVIRRQRALRPHDTLPVMGSMETLLEFWRRSVFSFSLVDYPEKKHWV